MRRDWCPGRRARTWALVAIHPSPGGALDVRRVLNAASEHHACRLPAVHEMPGVVAGWKSPEQMSNLTIMRNLLTALNRHAVPEHVTTFQETKAYGVHHHPIRVSARESEPRDPHHNFY